MQNVADIIARELNADETLNVLRVQYAILMGWWLDEATDPEGDALRTYTLTLCMREVATAAQFRKNCLEFELSYEFSDNPWDL